MSTNLTTGQMTCDTAERWLARYADDPGLVDSSGDSMGAHLRACASCRAVLDDQRAVAAMLRARPADRVAPAFAARLADRLDEASGWFGIADWRAWTYRLAPVAAALAVTVWMTMAPASSGSTPSAVTEASGPALEQWTLPASSASEASLFRADVTSESVLELMLIGEAPVGGGGDVR